MPQLPGVTIASGPHSWQIIQQDDTGHASMELSGRREIRSPADTDSARHWVEARLVYESSGYPVGARLDWTRAETEQDGKWNVTLRDVPAGGLYRVETRVCRRGLPDERPLRGDYIHCIGVGDLWCIAGQSNASGTGAGITEDPPELGVHLFANDEQWKLATHPLEDATHTLHPITVTGIYHGHSPWLAFAKTLKDRLNHPIGLIPTALGGSPLQMWNPKEPGEAVLYENMMDMIGKAGGRIRGIVWYQGESDCSPALAATYLSRFKQFVARVRRDLGVPDLPIITAQLNRCATFDCRLNPAKAVGLTPESHRAWSVVREAQRQAAREVSGVCVIPTLDLSLSDVIHNSAPSEVVLGHRFAQVALGQVYQQDSLNEFPNVMSAQFASPDRQELLLQFSGVAGGWWALGVVEDFAVDDGDGWIPLDAAILGDEGEVRLRLSRPTTGAVRVHAGYGADPVSRVRDGNQRPMLAFSVDL